ncbi:MAG TPA: hypothetical protein VLX11_05810 [Candidatus Acidoferrales bacterium]|nr:hypothetical protein [Candidatus Acidoferrales bacterium]
MNQGFVAGIKNCVEDCGAVERGQSVYVVSEEGAADRQVADAIADVARERGAKVNVVWGPKIPKNRPENIPADVLQAYSKADLLFSHYPSLKREALHPHFPGEKRTRVPNRARTVDLMSTRWAAFPYSVQRALAVTIDTLSALGKSWRITSPSGTDVRGQFGTPDSAVAQAYFVEEEGGRARRNFPGGVHSPAMAVATEGVIVADHIAGFGSMSTTNPIKIELKDSRIVSISGDDRTMQEKLSKTDGFIDSWHAGVNPMTVVPYARAENPVEWYSYSHCSPTIVHFHVGRSTAPIDAACFHQSIVIDGRQIYDRGKLTLWDDPAVAASVKASAMPAEMTENNVIALV